MKGGVALGAALVAGAARSTPAMRRRRARPAPASDDPSKVLGGPLRPYGERSRFEQSVRQKAPASDAG